MDLTDTHLELLCESVVDEEVQHDHDDNGDGDAKITQSTTDLN